MTVRPDATEEADREGGNPRPSRRGPTAPVPPARGGAGRTVRRFHVNGIVQGVGFRPFVYRTASTLGLSGWVADVDGHVEGDVAGEPGAVDEFAARLRIDASTLARVAPRPADARAAGRGAGHPVGGSIPSDARDRHRRPGHPRRGRRLAAHGVPGRRLFRQPAAAHRDPAAAAGAGGAGGGRWRRAGRGRRHQRRPGGGRRRPAGRRGVSGDVSGRSGADPGGARGRGAAHGHRRLRRRTARGVSQL